MHVSKANQGRNCRKINIWKQQKFSQSHNNITKQKIYTVYKELCYIELYKSKYKYT